MDYKIIGFKLTGIDLFIYNELLKAECLMAKQYAPKVSSRDVMIAALKDAAAFRRIGIPSSIIEQDKRIRKDQLSKKSKTKQIEHLPVSNDLSSIVEVNCNQILKPIQGDLYIEQSEY